MLEIPKTLLCQKAVCKYKTIMALEVSAGLAHLRGMAHIIIVLQSMRFLLKSLSCLKMPLEHWLAI